MGTGSHASDRGGGGPDLGEDDVHAERRAELVRSIAARGVSDQNVLQAIGSVARHRFVDQRSVDEAYEDHPLGIGCGQTISQPYVVAIMATAAEISPTDRVAEIGTGSGYGAAVLGRLASEVWTVERHSSLADAAAERLTAEGFTNVHVVIGDGASGIGAHSPFDAIVVTAAALTVPPALVAQRGDGGRLVIPVGPRSAEQRLYRIRRSGDDLVTDDLGAVRFVPLVEGEPP